MTEIIKIIGHIKTNLKVLAVFVILSILLVGCNRTPHHATPQEIESYDSIVSVNRQPMKLDSLIEQFIAQDDKQGLTIAYNQKGKQLRNDNLFFKSIDVHNKGLVVAQDINDTISIVMHLNNIGTNYRRLGILDVASTYHYKALRYSERYSDKSTYVAMKNRVISLNGIGNIHLSLMNYEVADSALRLALEGERQLGSDLGQAINYSNLGYIYEVEGQIDSARAYYQMSYDHNVKAESNLGLSLCHNHFGRLYELEKEWDKAIDEYSKAYEIMENSGDHWHWLESCIALARVHIEKNNMPEAKRYLDLAAETARDINSLEFLESTYQLYYTYYKKLGNSQLALDSYIAAENYSDSIRDHKKDNHIQNVRVQYERERQQQTIDAINALLESERKYKKIEYIAIVTFLLLIIILLYALRVRASKLRLVRQMEENRSNFFTNITHEFRTPITVILGFSRDIANGKYQGEELNRVANVISSQGKGLLNLVNQLLDISKVKSGIGNAEWRYGNAISYMHMVVEKFIPSAQQQGVDLEFAPAENSVMMDFVPDYMHKVVYNLISNSLKFTQKGGHIHISSGVKNNRLEMRFADDGVGISPNDIDNIFEPFYRGENASAEIGTGIGLSLVGQMVQAMNGTITVKSIPSKGTVFTILLPIGHASQILPLESIEEFRPVALPRQGEIEAQVVVSKDNLENKPIVLIVEDNTNVAAYISNHLTDNYSVYYARNGAEGLSKALEIVPDVIVTDLMMPEMDGIEMCRRIRANETVNHIPIIVITAKSEDRDKLIALNVGVDAYLIKPFNSEELLIRVANLIEQRKLLVEKYQRALSSGDVCGEDMSVLERQFISNFVDVVYSLMSRMEPTDLETVAIRLNMTSRTLSRKVVAVTGDAPLLYINKIKIAKAKNIIESDSSISLSDVACKCGFDDPNYFSRIFKQLEGITPTAYRRKMK